MKWRVSVLTHAFAILSILSGCQRDMPKPETKPKNLSLVNMNIPAAKTVIASSRENEAIPSLFVQYESKGNNVFVECIVTGVTFRENNQSNRKVGKIIVWVDGKKSQEVSAAAFIIKDLAYGNHKLKLEVVNLHNKSYGLSKEFMVNIPNN
ncbi:hypothetical protein [Bacillus sp. EB600]|uniref:hypothetical protein n=1 Tax=Bacillus sp. EB600 TaxID=2806345 RepID=UPI00210D7307|nr:hypothetical protein [Bacillus sp. EB600]MCQ6279779.1 hypothetical protein [Bacillus sp. EB600]